MASTSDPKLLLRPVVVIKRLDLLQHLDQLSEVCLKDLQGVLKGDVLKIQEVTTEPHSTVHEEVDDDDEIQVLDVVSKSPKKESSSIALKRVNQDPEVKKLRRRALLSREIFKPTVKRITNKTILSPTMKVPEIELIGKSIMEQTNVVNDKLAALKEREKKILATARARKKKVEDPTVTEELQAMAQLERETFPEVRKQDKIPKTIESIFSRSVRKFDEEWPVVAQPVVAQPEPSLFSFAKPLIQKHEIISKQKLQELFHGDEATLKILEVPARTLEEKFRILEARDKLYQSRRNKAVNRGKRLVGTCPDMCPEKERIRRNYQSQISPFEMHNFSMSTDIREEWMVKEYARSSADQDIPLPHDLRPVPVLQRTMEHLCRNIVNHSEFNDYLLDEWYMFMWDRTRAIRKDLTQQDSCSPEAVSLLEQCARFHIHCAERLVDQDISVYDEKINTENLTKCLQTLKYMYNDLRSMGVVCTNAPEFLCYSLLLNLNNPAIITEVRDMPEDLLSSKPICFALDIISARETKNYVRFFNLAKSTTYLNCCIIRRYFSEMRLYALSTMVRAFGSPRLTVAVPLLSIVESLLFESVQDCITHLTQCNLSVEERDNVHVVLLDKKTFQPPEMAFPVLPSVMYIREKKRFLLSEIIWGGPLNESSELQSIENSFTSAGEFKLDTLTIELLVEDKTPLILETDTKVDSKPEIEEGEEGLEEYDVDEACDNFSEDVSVEDGVFCNYEESSAPSNQNSSPKIASSIKSIFASPLPATSSFSFRFDSQPAEKPVPCFSFGNNYSAPENVFKTTNFVPTMSTVQQPPPKVTMPQSIVPESQKPMLVEINTFSVVHEETKRLEKEKILEEKLLKERLEKLQRDEAMRKEKEAEKARAEQRQAELNRLLKEKLKKEEEEQRKKEMLAEKQRKDEIARQNKIKRKLETLKEKYCWWKVEFFARLWRTKTNTATEARRMEKYLKALAISYPPICEPEIVNDNLPGIIIPNILLLKRRPNKEFRPFLNTSRMPMSGPPPALPLVHIGRAVASTLQSRIHTLYPDQASPYRSCFPWKLLLCLPGDEETQVRLDTFLEMHFVDRFSWKFGQETGPLAECSHHTGTTNLVISVRRVKGLENFEGNVSNPKAVIGTNSFLFFLTDDVRVVHIAKQRLDKIRRLSGSSKIPVVGFVFGDRLSQAFVRRALDLDESANVVTCGGANQQSLVSTLSESLSLAAAAATHVPRTRSVTISSLLSTPLLELFWHRSGVTLLNFDFILMRPDALILAYNKCLEDLLDLFLDENASNESHLAPEFESTLSSLEAPLQFQSPPLRNQAYSRQLKDFFSDLKLPLWPNGPVRSTHDLNYRLHQYGKLIVNGDKTSQKYLKWRVYRKIQKTLLWKGLDIYCEEDIEVILQKFPWIGVFQEFSSARVEYAKTQQKGRNLIVTYNSEHLKAFSFPAPVLDAFTQNTDYLISNEEVEAKQPKPEKDSILLAYAKAIEREREGNKTPEPSLSEQISQTLDETLPFLDVIAREEPIKAPTPEGSQLKRGFDDLDNTLAEMANGLEKRRKLLQEMMEAENLEI